MGHIEKTWLSWFFVFYCLSSYVFCQPEVAECLGDTQFIAVMEAVSFDEALDRCVSRNALLAGITNNEENNLVEDLADRLDPNSTVSFWIGKFKNTCLCNLIFI